MTTEKSLSPTGVAVVEMIRRGGITSKNQIKRDLGLSGLGTVTRVFERMNIQVNDAGEFYIPTDSPAFDYSSAVLNKITILLALGTKTALEISELTKVPESFVRERAAHHRVKWNDKDLPVIVIRDSQTTPKSDRERMIQYLMFNDVVDPFELDSTLGINYINRCRWFNEERVYRDKDGVYRLHDEPKPIVTTEVSPVNARIWDALIGTQNTTQTAANEAKVEVNVIDTFITDFNVSRTGAGFWYVPA